MAWMASKLSLKVEYLSLMVSRSFLDSTPDTASTVRLLWKAEISKREGQVLLALA